MCPFQTGDGVQPNEAASVQQLADEAALVQTGRHNLVNPAVTDTVNLPVAFADANYSVSIVPPVNVGCWVTNKLAASFDVNISAAQGAPIDLDWIARHD